MMLEAAFMFDYVGNVMKWHLPPGRSSGYIPDTVSLWEFLRDNRDTVKGVAHLHPWDGPAAPSHVDLTTFFALDNGLGKNHFWPIFTFTSGVYLIKVEKAEGGGTFYPVIGDENAVVGFYKEVIPMATPSQETIDKLREIGRKGL